MNYIVLDLEWNQSSTPQGENKDIPFEIIEIGAIKLNCDRVMIGEFNQIVKPQVYHELHRITSKLIHMQMQELEKGRPFVTVMKEFLEWCGPDPIFGTWGPLDLVELQNNMEYYGMEPMSKGPFPFLDIQKLFSIAFEDGKSRKALEYAVDFLKIEKDIPFHRAFSDAYYTGKVLSAIKNTEVLKNYSYDVFHLPGSKKEEIFTIFGNYAKYISRRFVDRQEALADREVISSKCYLCHKNIRKKIRWFTPNGKHYLCVAYCDKHGYMKGKIRIKKAPTRDGADSNSEAVYVIKTMKFISEKEATDVRLRQERAKEIRRSKRHRAGELRE